MSSPEWAVTAKVGISVWTKFRVNSGPIDDALFVPPLLPWKDHIFCPFYGRIAESPTDCFLVTGWESRGIYDQFKESPQYQELMTNLGADGMGPETKTIAFTKRIFGQGFTSNTEILTVYWPTTIFPETQEAVKKMQSLAHRMRPSTSCHGHWPSFGWIDGLQTWNGENVLANVWCNKWVSKELEEEFRRTEKRPVRPGGVEYALSVDLFEQDLKALGAVGWDSATPTIITNLDGQESTHSSPGSTESSPATSSVITGSNGELSTVFPTTDQNGISSAVPTVIADSDGHISTILPTTSDNPGSTDPSIVTGPDAQETTIGSQTGIESDTAIPTVITESHGKVTTILPPATESSPTSPDGQVSTILPTKTTASDENSSTLINSSGAAETTTPAQETTATQTGGKETFTTEATQPETTGTEANEATETPESQTTSKNSFVSSGTSDATGTTSSPETTAASEESTATYQEASGAETTGSETTIGPTTAQSTGSDTETTTAGTTELDATTTEPTESDTATTETTESDATFDDTTTADSTATDTTKSGITAIETAETETKDLSASQSTESNTISSEEDMTGSETTISTGAESRATDIRTPSDTTASTTTTSQTDSGEITSTGSDDEITETKTEATDSADKATTEDAKVTTSDDDDQPPSTKMSDPTSTSDDYFIALVTTKVTEPHPEDDGFVIPYNLWFFDICIGPILGWKPEYTVGPKQTLTFSEEPTECETESAELCVTGTSYSVTVDATTTSTVASDVISTCGTVYGCKVEDVDQSATATVTSMASSPEGTTLFGKEQWPDTLESDEGLDAAAAHAQSELDRVFGIMDPSSTTTSSVESTTSTGEESSSSSEMVATTTEESEETSTTESPTPTPKTPDHSNNKKHCYDSGQKAGYGAIEAAAESFCHNVVDDDEQGPIRSNYKREDKKNPPKGYHFILSFEVYEGCGWEADYDECMRYMRVPIDSCDCSAKGNKQGGWVENNCIKARIDPNSGS
ncbi:hypothetical protein CDV31_013702 [Fusarium ambrosium]|uniref:Uncharacterized protein n=1 Tax=Fusarium ambrosium TaxID=131363 RepID=A0A428T1J7_9HYPO|nr:hypothetical protein CDV31_013702 [Fusarium ambrosium]